MIAIYWETVARWMNLRAERNALALRTPLILIQAADEASPVMPIDVYKKLMNRANPQNTGGMHGMLEVHIGMRIRLLKALAVDQSLVKDSEGVIVRVVPNPLDDVALTTAIESSERKIYLRHLPLGIWVRMDKFAGAAFTQDLQDADGGVDKHLTQSLVFIEPETTNEMFDFQSHHVTHKVKRTQFPISHGRVITATACQGRTMSEGVIIDCERYQTGNAKKDEDWWLDLYVMLSRATRLEDLLLVRAPPIDFFQSGPPVSMRRQLAAFARLSAACHTRAEEMAQELGFSRFFH